MTLAPSCGKCAFWYQNGPLDGTCRRRAPSSAITTNEIAHWPMTLSQERCGDGVLRNDQVPPLVSCHECRFWQTNITGGIDPMNRRDAPREWWQSAGHCLRHAPEPSSDPGCRGFWHATSRTDRCGEGETT